MSRTKRHWTKNQPASNLVTKRQKDDIKKSSAKEGSNEEVILADVRRLLATQNARDEDTGNADAKADPSSTPSTYVPPERFSEIEVKIVEQSSTGDGLGLSANLDHVYVVPFAIPGDVVQAKVVNYFAKDNYTSTDFLKVIEPSTRRDDSRARCPYFSRCSGCQFQMLSYEDQLAHKKTIIQRAYQNFSTLAPQFIPTIGETIGSPLQYSYRTKLTPHFDGPPGSQHRRGNRDGQDRKGFEQVPPIGFMLKGTRKIIDIEDCPIGTDAVRIGMKSERERVAKEIASYKRGATLLLRESTSRIERSRKDTEDSALTVPAKPEVDQPVNAEARLDIPPNQDEEGMIGIADPEYIESKFCITDSNATSTEYVDNFVFSNTAGAFFQNNNSILPSFTAYIRDHILPPASTDEIQPPKYLIDAYCGSGLFTVTLSSLFASSTGIDISPASIVSANQNAKANNISNATFMTADAPALFKEVNYPPMETVVVIDPPRKGCDDAFLQQLLGFGPRRVVYVSCNVHTQARDVSVLVDGRGDCKYDIESIRGFDFFPQTGHVEGIAILNRHMEAQQEPGGDEEEERETGGIMLN
ncbi:tRNA(m5U54)methyltransferase [Lignoscripta atroalba]|nr:tRNA(m5U54)methyltransferase [Lignoscripta atroalba]